MKVTGLTVTPIEFRDRLLGDGKALAYVARKAILDADKGTDATEVARDEIDRFLQPFNNGLCDEHKIDARV